MVEETVGINVEALLKHGASTAECVESVIAISQIDNLIKYARSGDAAAAKQILALASIYLNPEIFGLMPISLRRYLKNAFVKISLGESADTVLNLKRNGRPRREFRTKLVIAHWIYKEIQKGKSLEDAGSDCEEFFRENIRAHGELYGYTEPPDSKTLEGIYSKALPEIQQIYKDVQEIKSRLKS